MSFLNSSLTGKKFIEESYADEWTQGIFSKSNVNGLIAIFYNSATKVYFASEVYTEVMLNDFIEETERKSKGKLINTEILPEKDFDRSYKRVKAIREIGLDIILPI